MSKKLILVLVIVIFLFSWGHLVFASLIVNEIMYDLPGSDSVSSKSREWVEVYNSDATDITIDASKWRIYDGSANRTMNGEVDFSIPAKGFVVFAGDKDTFLADNQNFKGIVYDAGFTSLNNTGTTLKIVDQNGNVVDSANYSSSQGGAGDGNSLQLINGSWVSATPTPGFQNDKTTISDTSVGGGLAANNIDSVVSTTNNISKNKTIEEPKIKTKIIANKKIYFVDIPVPLEGVSYGYQGELLHYGKYFWNFGDGDSKEMPAIDNQKFTHTYFYPGDYTLFLNYYSNSYEEMPDASDQVLIKIIPTDISISKVGNEKDFFVQLSNNTDYDVDISNWYLRSEQKSFKIPQNTVFSSKSNLIISPKITGFSISDKETLKLLTPQGNIVFSFSPSDIKQDFTEKTIGISEKFVSESKNMKDNQNKNLVVAGVSGTNKISVNNLVASVSDSMIPDTQDKENTRSLPLVPIFSFIFIGAFAYATYFIRQKKNISQKGDNFEILDE